MNQPTPAPSTRAQSSATLYGVVVLAVHPAGRGQEAYELPDPDRALARGDTLVLAGTAEALRTAQAA